MDRRIKQVFVPDEFFKLYDPRICSEQLRIPLAILKCFKGNIPVTSMLEDPVGRYWKVTLENIEPDVFFKGGWPDFVRDNSLEFGDFLTFSYDGKSKFKVKIYGINGCIKQNSISIKECDASTLQEKPKAADPQVDKPANLVSFEVVIQPSYGRTCLLNIPQRFGKRFMKEEQRRFEKQGLLQTCSGSWEVIVRSSSDRLQLRKGWGDFMRMNKLRAGDVCHFKLIDKVKFILEVSIERRPLVLKDTL